jgi:hypothetical protein
MDMQLAHARRAYCGQPLELMLSIAFVTLQFELVEYSSSYIFIILMHNGFTILAGGIFLKNK